MIETPYLRNDYMHNSSTNLKIGKIREMSRAKFDVWADQFRAEVTYAWDNLGIPVIGGRDADGIVKDFKSLANYDVAKLARADETTGELDCLSNPGAGSTCRQFFPTMLKTKDISKQSLDRVSIYKFFADDGLSNDFKKFVYAYIHKEGRTSSLDDNKTIMDAASFFRVCFPLRPAGNFSPVVAKYLYLNFTKHI